MLPDIAEEVGGGENVFLDRPQQVDEQRLREVVCERRSVGLCCHESPHDEAVSSLVRLFHRVSPRGWVNSLPPRSSSQLAAPTAHRPPPSVSSPPHSMDRSSGRPCSDHGGVSPA